MNASLYIIRSYHENATVTVETNSAEVMLDAFNEALEAGLPSEVICGTTGEILASHDCGCGEYTTDEFVNIYLSEITSIPLTQLYCEGLCPELFS